MLNIADFFDELKLKGTEHIVDLGAGVGREAKILSPLVEAGKIFALDVHKDLLEHLETDITRDESLKNITPVWADFENIEGTRLRDESIDIIIINNTFSHLTHKKVAVMEMKRILKSGGRILFVDWHKHLGESTLHKQSVLNEEDIRNLFLDMSFKVHDLIHKDEYHFVLLIEKK